MTPQAAERLVVTAFGIVATLRRRPWWSIHQPAVEVRPWSADLAKVINDLPLPYLDALGKAGAGAAVAAGLVALTIPRIQDDAEFNAMPPDYQAAVLANYRGGTVPKAPEPAPTRMPQATPDPAPAPATADRPKHTGGAAPASPGHIEGISGNGFAA